MFTEYSFFDVFVVVIVVVVVVVVLVAFIVAVDVDVLFVVVVHVWISCICWLRVSTRRGVAAAPASELRSAKRTDRINN